MKNLEYHLKFENSSEYSKKIRKHIQETLSYLKHIKLVRMPSDETISKSQFRLIPNQTLNSVKAKSNFYVTQEKFTLIFDLDETLIHVSSDGRAADAYIPVKLKEGQQLEVLLINSSSESISARLCEIFYKGSSLPASWSAGLQGTRNMRTT